MNSMMSGHGQKHLKSLGCWLRKALSGLRHISAGEVRGHRRNHQTPENGKRQSEDVEARLEDLSVTGESDWLPGEFVTAELLRGFPAPRLKHCEPCQSEPAIVAWVKKTSTPCFRILESIQSGTVNVVNSIKYVHMNV